MNKQPSVLAVMAHPDDAELRCFGTLLKYKEIGYECKLLVVSGGENGISLQDKLEYNIDYIPKTEREHETRSAFENTGIEIDILQFDDGNIRLDKSLIAAIEKVIRDFAPDVVITHCPEDLGVDHQDHSAVGKAAINIASRVEGVKKILLCEPLLTLRAGFIPNYFVDITKYFNRKMEALSHHKTQHGRYYLEEHYHVAKSVFYSLSLGAKPVEEGLKHEVFNAIFTLET
ncbi:PIG-L deacetylase family protein [Mesobacillus zeae]|nr:PIG-L deacetylase family protein [Mesobacillus zeae]